MKALKNFYISPLFARWAVFSWMALVFVSSTQPSLKVSGVNQTIVDHLLDFAHFPVYFIMAVLMIFAIGSFKIRHLVSAFLFVFFFGVLNEFLQLHVPGRSFSVKDMMVNGGGALLATITIYFLRTDIP